MEEGKWCPAALLRKLMLFCCATDVLILCTSFLCMYLLLLQVLIEVFILFHFTPSKSYRYYHITIIYIFHKYIGFGVCLVHFHLQETSGLPVLSPPSFFSSLPDPFIISSLSWLRFALLTCGDVTTFWQETLPLHYILRSFWELTHFSLPLFPFGPFKNGLNLVPNAFQQ